jgi:hypothetical protein
MGCIAKIAATMNASIMFFLNRKYMRKKTRIVFRICSKILLIMKGLAEIPFGQSLQLLSFKLRLKIVRGW